MSIFDTDDLAGPICAARAADDKLGRDTVILDVGEVLAITGYFVITTASNARQIRAVTAEVEHQIKQAGGPGPSRIEGLGSSEWVLMDYGDFIVHVFGDDARSHYQLDRLWGDRPQVDWAEPST